MSHPTEHVSVTAALKGRVFVNPLFDYMLIGGGLSLIVTAIVWLTPAAQKIGSGLTPAALSTLTLLPYVILLSNSAHFAASTVRLYTKPGTHQSLPFVTMGFPLVALLLLTLCMFYAGRFGPHLQSLYLTWSPYHYAAQAYGLAVMYSYRSGCRLDAGHKKLLWWSALAPFFYAVIRARDAGVGWLVPDSVLAMPVVKQIGDNVSLVLLIVTFAAPALLAYRVWNSKAGPMPAISLLVVFTNGIWFVVLDYLSAFVWATMFHGIQYLAIVIIFHVKDQMARPDNRRSATYHVVWFYVACVGLGYGLFSILPRAYELAGFGRVESLLLVVAVINIHHFIVDAFIWRLKKGDSNRQVVESSQPVTA